ncbi:hypothetical protein IWQ56_005729 [Coemansia nantahalensis]|uniref:Uncharacterized protein n=2 Tax=Coemansia TaxID=4863 RepID=A0ACC1LGU6_9FUNG|nr:hypothetical protein IWQ57_006951 [Coemansia nantahalensis]KAJ2759466.1 hypothetical protein IWQ56_005729 [Coemansia nantahalensis]KAJ2807975.1 hypothetical protein H4R21_000266 [Coemansia helicoidea]
MPVRRPQAAKKAASALAGTESRVSRVAEGLALLNFKYEVMVGHYILNTWEKTVVNVVIFTCVAFVVRVLVTSSLLAAAAGGAVSAVRAWWL